MGRSLMQKRITRLDKWDVVKVNLMEIAWTLSTVGYALLFVGAIFLDGTWPSSLIVVIFGALGLFVSIKLKYKVQKSFHDEEKDHTFRREYVNGRTCLYVITMHLVLLSLCALAVTNVQYNFTGQDFVYDVETKQDEVLPVVSYLPLEPNKTVKYSTDLELLDVRLVTSFELDSDKNVSYVIDARYSLKVDQKSWIDFVHAEAQNQKNSTIFFKLEKVTEKLLQEGLEKKMVDWNASYFASESFQPLFQKIVRELFLENGLRIVILKVEILRVEILYQE